MSIRTNGEQRILSSHTQRQSRQLSTPGLLAHLRTRITMFMQRKCQNLYASILHQVLSFQFKVYLLNSSISLNCPFWQGVKSNSVRSMGSLSKGKQTEGPLLNRPWKTKSGNHWNKQTHFQKCAGCSGRLGSPPSFLWPLEKKN